MSTMHLNDIFDRKRQNKEVSLPEHGQGYDWLIEDEWKR
jgi:hypothetical protein